MLRTEGPPDTELLSRYCSGDRDAFTEFYQRHRNGLYGYALALTADVADAADLAQETWLALVRKPQAVAAAGNARAYLYRSLRNRHIDSLRKRSRERRAIAEGVPASPLIVPRDELMASERAAEVDAALRSLPAEQREVVLLKIYGGLTFQEVAAVLDENARTVESRHRLALNKLRERLGGESA